jgi:hypothetical protein
MRIGAGFGERLLPPGVHTQGETHGKGLRRTTLSVPLRRRGEPPPEDRRVTPGTTARWESDRLQRRAGCGFRAAPAVPGQLEAVAGNPKAFDSLAQPLRVARRKIPGEVEHPGAPEAACVMVLIGATIVPGRSIRIPELGRESTADECLEALVDSREGDAWFIGPDTKEHLVCGRVLVRGGEEAIDSGTLLGEAVTARFEGLPENRIGGSWLHWHGRLGPGGLRKSRILEKKS